MSDVQTAIGLLSDYALELNKLSSQLAQVERWLEPVQGEVDEFTDAFILGLYTRSTEDDAFKLPSEDIRSRMARRALPPELYGRHTALLASRDRLKRRIGDLRSLVDAQRSILSAEKIVSEATGLQQPTWTGSAA